MCTRFSEWAAIYNPIQNPIKHHDHFAGRFFGLTSPEMEVVEKAANVWTLVQNGDKVELVFGIHRANSLGHFVAAQPYTGQTSSQLLLENTERDSPEHFAIALMRAQQCRSVDVAGQHEADLYDRANEIITEAQYLANEAAREQYIDQTTVFFNLMLGEFCIEDVPLGKVNCGQCGATHPSDPCRVCGRTQPVSINDYFRANTCVIALD
jgi:hypothetical protein